MKQTDAIRLLKCKEYEENLNI